MLKEIHEQAEAVAETIADRTARGDGVDLDDLGPIDDDFLRRCRRIVVVACGTSYHAGLIGRYAIEEWARARSRDGRRQRVPLPQPGRRPGRPRDRHLPVRRDRRHAGGDAARARARRDRAGDHQRHGLPGDARRRRRALHPLGPRGERRRHQDVRRPGVRDVPARAAHGRAARHARARAPAELVGALKRIPHCVEELLASVAEAAIERTAQAHHELRLLPLPRPPRRPAGRARGRAEAEGDLLHRDRRVRRRAR